MRKDIKIMGIMNINSNSFYSSSRTTKAEDIKNRINLLLEQGADILDFGACSTRPGSIPISQKEEWEHLFLALNILNKNHPNQLFSIDTFRSEIVKRAYNEFGPFIINDITASEYDSKMLPLCSKLGLEYIAMHMRGMPKDMQDHCQYEDVVKDIISYFKNFDFKAKEYGINDWILDPGFGFSKTLEQNYEMMNRLEEFQVLGKRILVGISRKSFIYKKIGMGPEDALEGTSKLHKIALAKGANILRVHDVKAAKLCLPLL
ncbi:MAG: dihydropteroate synthase [Bacteroidales bacterium]